MVRLLEIATSSVVPEMNTLKKQSTSRVAVPAYRGWEVLRNTGMRKTSLFRILHGVLKLYLYYLQLFWQLLPDIKAKQMAFAKWAFSEFEENPQWLLSILWWQMRLTFHWMEQKTHTTVVSEQRRTHMHTQRTHMRTAWYCLVWFYLKRPVTQPQGASLSAYGSFPEAGSPAATITTKPSQKRKNRGNYWKVWFYLGNNAMIVNMCFFK